VPPRDRRLGRGPARPRVAAASGSPAPARRRGGGHRRLLAAVLALAAGAGAGCAALPGGEPDLERLYHRARSERRPPVVVLPGVLGSRLRDEASGRLLWPGGTWDLLTGRRFEELEVRLDDEGRPLPPGPVRPSGLFFEAFGRDYYSAIVRTLEGPGGYRCAPLEELDARTDCVLLAWDWRRDLVEGAGRLAEAIARLRALRGDPSLRVDVVAHSAGGLVARYFLRFGARDVLGREAPEEALDARGAAAVRRLVLIATPNYGSVSALQRAITGGDVGVATLRPEVLATMPSLFQLFPNPERTWMIDPHGRRLEVALFDVATWRRFRWSIFDPEVRRRIARAASDPERELAAREAAFERFLLRARRFHRALSVPLEAADAQVVVFGGDCVLTPARCLLEEVDGQVRVRLRPERVVNRVPGADYEALMLAPGDGRVTKASLLSRDTLDPDTPQPAFFSVAWTMLLCREHDRLPSDITFRDNLLHTLLY